MASRQLDEEAIFHVARDIPKPGTRSNYLDQVCAGDQALRERVEALLEVHEQEAEFLKSKPEAGPTEDQPPISERPGQQIGRYKLLDKLGEGGMGVVFMAEQLRPVKRRVAVKIIKQGMDTRQFIARFEAERQALAIMDHPNIARVLDGGCTETGRPYFVMELVKGVPVTKFCDENRLTARQRVELFVSVCHAVQHAHQKGIIHRDLKPSNVLVALYDDRPVPKVIDFGVAKATNQQLTERTLFTQVGQIVGTWEYMSPEQAVLNQLDVDTRTDIYSLGVILYELLTGVTPLEPDRLRSAALEEALRLIREEEPPKPSTRISSLGETATATAAYRGTDATSLAKAVRGDVDWIVMKALEKNRARRYETANGLAADLNRYLNAQPIEARPPSTFYRLRKTASRHRAALVTTAVVALALLAGTVTSTWLALREMRARKDLERAWVRAAEEEQKAKDSLEKARTILFDKVMMYALAGDVDRTKLALTDAEDVDIPRAWVPFALGVAYSWRGDQRRARKRFDEALRIDKDFYAANAASVQVVENEREMYERLATFHSTSPATPLDYLFQSQAYSYYSTTRSLEALNHCGGWKKTTMASFFRAIANVNQALESKDLGQAKEQIGAFDDLLRWYPDNAVPLNGKLYALLAARNIAASEDRLDNAKQFEIAAAEAAERVEKYSADIYWVARTRAWYFAESKQGQRSIDEWKKRMHREPFGSDPMHYAACLRLFADEADYAEAVAALPCAYGVHNAHACLAKAYLLAATNASRQEVAAACDELLEREASPELRCGIVEVWLAYGDWDEARNRAEAQLRDLPSRVSEIQSPWKLALEYVAEEIYEEEFLAQFSAPAFQAKAEYFVALVCFARKDPRARHYFSECYDTGQFVAKWYWWSKVFLAQIERSAMPESSASGEGQGEGNSTAPE